MDTLLKVLEDNATLTPAQLAVMLDKEEGDIKKLIEKYEADGVILGYKTMIDWDKTDREYVTAMIEVKMTPQRDRGFDRIAERAAERLRGASGEGIAEAQRRGEPDGRHYPGYHRETGPGAGSGGWWFRCQLITGS